MLRAVSFNPANVAITGGTIKVDDGSAAAPSYSFASDTNSGFYRIANEQVGVAVNGVGTFRFAQGGFDNLSAGVIRWSSSGSDITAASDLILARDAANTLAQRNGTTAQTDRLYNTFTNASNGEWLQRSWATNIATIATTANGTGVVRQLVITSPQITGYLTSAPVTNTGATYTVIGSDTYLTADVAGTQTLTLGTATAGRVLKIRTITANTVVSASSNVVPRAGGAAGTAILAAVDGAWAELVGDGTNWQIMASS